METKTKVESKGARQMFVDIRKENKENAQSALVRIIAGTIINGVIIAGTSYICNLREEINSLNEKIQSYNQEYRSQSDNLRHLENSTRPYQEELK
jgi:hypothetical protein